MNKTNQFLMILLLTLITSSSVIAQDRYEYCRDRAQDISGYYGPTPNRYKPGGALEGAFKGAATGAALAWIGGKDKRKAAKRGAALGALFGAMKRGAAKSKERKRRREYEFELRACMSSRN